MNPTQAQPGINIGVLATDKYKGIETEEENSPEMSNDEGLPEGYKPPKNLVRVPVVQRIEHWFPKPRIQVRFLSGTADLL